MFDQPSFSFDGISNDCAGEGDAEQLDVLVEVRDLKQKLPDFAALQDMPYERHVLNHQL